MYRLMIIRSHSAGSMSIVFGGPNRAPLKVRFNFANEESVCLGSYQIDVFRKNLYDRANRYNTGEACLEPFEISYDLKRKI